MSLHLRFALRSDVGLLREENEDAAYAGPRLLAVADGMGGHAAGEVASAEAIAALAPLDEDTPGADLITALREAVDQANARLRDLVDRDKALAGMGTTLTALLWSGHRLGLVHVGDSRCYLLRDGALTQITHDHTLVQQFVDEGRISAEEASYHPQRALITRALDGAPELELDLSVRESRAGDRYLLCTDGLSGVVSEETMLDALRDPEPAKACEQLVDLALRGGGPDNVTCIVADVVDSAAPDAEALVPVVAGAATFDPTTPAPRSDTPAGRAALATWARRAARLHRAPSSAPTPTRPRLRPVIVTLVVVAVLAGLAVGADAYLRSQWFVGATDGPSRSVAIFRGLNASVAGLRLASVARRTGLPLQALDGYDRQQVEAGIPVSGLASGQAKVTQLRIDACTGLTSRLPQVRHPHPAPSARPRSRPRTTSSPAPVPSQLASLLAAAGCGGASQ